MLQVWFEIRGGIIGKVPFDIRGKLLQFVTGRLLARWIGLSDPAQLDKVAPAPGVTL